jgi:anti-anti-sigma regulatory factor
MAAKPAKPTIIALTGDLDIFSIQAQVASLKASLGGPGPHVVDLGGLGDLDLSGVQALVAATQGRAPGSIRFQGLPEPLAERFKDLGLQEFLGEVMS